MATTDLTLESFQQTITENDTVLVDFWAESCKGLDTSWSKDT